MPRRNHAVTLIELIIAIVLMSLVVLGLANIDFFSHFHVITSERRAKVQNEVSYALEHMAKEISKAIGDTNNPPAVIDESNRRVKVYIDYNQTGQIDSGDRWIAYRYRDSLTSTPYQFWYCPQCLTPTCDACTPDDWNSTNFINNGYVLSKKISGFNPAYIDNYIETQITGRWDATKAASRDNPEITMRTRINMPSVSLR